MPYSTRALVAALVMSTFLAGCSDDDTGPSSTVDFTGSYALVSFQQGPVGPLGPPVATGTLTMTSTRYKVTVNIPAASLAIVDSGTYTATATTITQTSQVQPVQSTGTWTQTGNLFTIDVTASGQRVVSSWQKQ